MFSKMVKKVLTTAIVLCMIAGSTVLCNVSAADGSENLYKGGTVTQNNTTTKTQIITQLLRNFFMISTPFMLFRIGTVGV